MRNIIIRKIYDRLFKSFGPMDWWPADTAFEVMVGAILTQNTAWTNVEKAIRNLKKEKMLNPLRLHNASLKKLTRLIRPAGYFNVKAKRLKSFLSFLLKEYGGNLRAMRKERTDSLREKLLRVHGIGQETCDSILLYALNKPVFVVDAYTRRIFSRYGIVEDYISYEQLQSIFTRSLPKSAGIYNEYHALIVKLGKEVCLKRPKCNLCPINRLCKKMGLGTL